MEFDTSKLIEQAPELIVTYGTQIFMALVIFIIGKWAVRLVANGLRKAMEKKEVDPTISKFVGSIVYTTLLAFVIIAALGQLGYRPLLSLPLLVPLA